MGEKRRQKNLVDTRNDAWRRNKYPVRAYLLLGVLAAILVLGSVLYIRAQAGSIWLTLPRQFQGTEEDLPSVLTQVSWLPSRSDEVYLPMFDGEGKPIPMPENASAMEGFQHGTMETDRPVFYYGGMKVENGVTKIRLEAAYTGSAFIDFRFTGDEAGESWGLRALPFFGKQLVVQHDGYFEGSLVTTVALLIFLLVLAVVTGCITIGLQRRALYSYRMVTNGSVFLFAIVQFLVVLYNMIRDFQSPGFSLFSGIVSAMIASTILISPIMLVGALLVALSNIQLIRHEGFRSKNLLGIFIAVVWIIALVLFGLLGRDFSGSEEEARRIQAMQTALATCMNFAFFLLVSTVFSAYYAQKHKPAFDKDYIIILGCRIRKDGTPTPILKGRVDCALAFEEKQFRKTGKHAIFVPSGGQGADEPTSEAEGMRQYLLSKGVPDERILPEGASENTSQNVRNSKKLILRQMPKARVAFATTNYHVFRSYVVSKENDIYAEGMAAKTKGYFFPNAFLREFFGLLYSNAIQLLVVLLASVALYVSLALLV